jgi:hypothetical protein
VNPEEKPMIDQVCLVLLETAGNQDFIFDTNKLAENVGASELTFRGGTKYVLEAVKVVGGPDLLEGCLDSDGTFVINIDRLWTNLLDRNRNRPLEDPSHPPVEVIVATSGKALLLVRDRSTATAIVRKATETAAREAPGLDLRGAIDDFGFDEPLTMHKAVKRVHQRHAALGSRVPGPRERFARLPVVDGCATSGLPASTLGKDGPTRNVPVSAVTKCKKTAASDGWRRIGRTLGAVMTEDERGLHLAPGPDVLDRMDLDWSAVIHADGNGFGQVFLRFQDYLPGGADGYDNRTYVDSLRRFSAGLNRCTRDAFRDALEILARRIRSSKRKKWRFLPVVPIVLGGDDLTVVVHGQFAVQLARDFLHRFELEAEALWVEAALTHPASGPQRFTACAGVAIVKPHYPFYAAYSLAGELLKSAKDVKKHEPGASALDFHILYDASGFDLKTIRSRLLVGDNTRLFARPYVVSLPGVAPSVWSSRRRIDDLDQRILKLCARDDEGRRRLPNSMLHELRAGLFLGRDAANARLELARGRHAEALDDLLADIQDGLYFDGKESDEKGEVRSVTPFLDALDLAEFWANDPEEVAS